MNNTLSKLTNMEENKNYLHKLKNGIKTSKILFTPSSFYKRQRVFAISEYYHKDYQKLSIKRPKRIIYLKLVSAALALYKNKICFYNVTVNKLNLDMYLHGGRVYFDELFSITPKIELTELVKLLKYTNIQALTINLSYKSMHNTSLYLSDVSLLQYIQQIQYLRQHIQKYCNDVHVEIYFKGDYYKCDFWNDAKCTNNSSKTYVMIYDQLSYTYENKYWGMIDKTRSNFHRNFKLK